MKKHVRLGHAGIVDHSVDLSIPDFKNGMDRSNKKKKKIKKYYINAKQQIPVPYGSMLNIPPTSLLLLAAKQEPYKKSLSLSEQF